MFSNFPTSRSQRDVTGQKVAKLSMTQPEIVRDTRCATNVQGQGQGVKGQGVKGQDHSVT